MTGQNADMLSDLGARFKAVASELFNIACYGDFVMKQAFVQTASGEYLDKHAALRDMERKTAAKAKGRLTFSVSAPAEQDIVIPTGTICSVEGREFLQFITTQSGTIATGDLNVSVNAEAMDSGSAYNVKTGVINVIVNPPGYVEAVNNADAFSGGYDDETDDMLRNRILQSYRVPATGLSKYSIAECVMKISDVVDCNIVKPSVSTLNAYVRTKTGTLPNRLKNRIEDALMVAHLTSATTEVILAQPSEYTLEVIVTPGRQTDSEEVTEKVTKAVRDFCNSVRIGECINLSDVQHAANLAADVTECAVHSAYAYNGVITCPQDMYLVPYTITVTCNE